MTTQKPTWIPLLVLLAVAVLALFTTSVPGTMPTEGLDTGDLINTGSLIGRWEKTYRWYDAGGERPSFWEPLNINNSDNYVFLENGTFTSTNNISDCLGTNGTYVIEGVKITLKYICEAQPEIIKEVVIDEFFFRENYIVFIQGNNYGNISKFELAD